MKEEKKVYEDGYGTFRQILVITRQRHRFSSEKPSCKIMEEKDDSRGNFYLDKMYIV